MAAKSEAVAGTAEVLAATDVFIASDVTLNPSWTNTLNEGQNGYLSKEPGVSGLQTANLEFTPRFSATISLLDISHILMPLPPLEASRLPSGLQATVARLACPGSSPTIFSVPTSQMLIVFWLGEANNDLSGLQGTEHSDTGWRSSRTC